MNQIFNRFKLTWLYWFPNGFEYYSICHLNWHGSSYNIFSVYIYLGTYKVRNEIETKRNETKRNETKRKEINENETKRNQQKRNETKRNQRNENEIKRNQRKQYEINENRNEIDWYEENGRTKIKDKTK
jgi:hypothetical protein